MTTNLTKRHYELMQVALVIALMVIGSLFQVPVDILYVVIPVAVMIGFTFTTGYVDDILKSVPDTNPMKAKPGVFKVVTSFFGSIYIFVRAVPVMFWPSWYMVILITVAEAAFTIHKKVKANRA